MLPLMCSKSAFGSDFPNAGLLLELSHGSLVFVPGILQSFVTLRSAHFIEMVYYPES